MKVEKLNSLDSLIGKSVIDVISLLPTLSWYVDPGGMQIEIKLSSLRVIDYDTWKPRQEIDRSGRIPIESGEPIPIEKISSFLTPISGRTTGLMSMVEVEGWKKNRPYYAVNPWLHLPLLDMDLKDEMTPERIEQVKKEIREKTEIEKGVLLVSGDEGHCHFFGLERLMTDDQLVTFIGLSLTMVDQKGEMLIDPKWAGYQLAPMSYHKELFPEVGWSAYDLGLRFLTLRIMTSEAKSRFPVVKTTL